MKKRILSLILAVFMLFGLLLQFVFAEEADYVRTTEPASGDQVIFYNPGHSMAISNAAYNDWYLIPQPITPTGDTINNPDAALIYTVKKNSDGTFSFYQGEDTIAVYAAGNFADMTNNASHSGADNRWNLAFKDGLFYFQSAGITYDYGVAYIECYYNANKDKTNISAYASSNPYNKSADFGFQFYVSYASPPCPHDWQSYGAVDATCAEPGAIRYYCPLCGLGRTEETAPALGHDIIEDAAVPATCTDPGLTAGEHCSRCDYKVTQKEIPALGHDLVIDEAVAPTCEEPGLTEGFHCTRCDYGVAQKEIPATGHNYENGTCTNCGAIEGHCPCWDYTDVDRASWYHSACDFVIARGIMGSTTTEGLTFEPAPSCLTRRATPREPRLHRFSCVSFRIFWKQNKTELQGAKRWRPVWFFDQFVLIRRRMRS